MILCHTMIYHQQMAYEWIAIARQKTSSRRQTFIFNIAEISLLWFSAGPWPIHISRRGFASWWHRVAATFTWNPQRALMSRRTARFVIELILWGLESGEYGWVFKGFDLQQLPRHLKDDMLQVSRTLSKRLIRKPAEYLLLRLSIFSMSETPYSWKVLLTITNRKIIVANKLH